MNVKWAVEYARNNKLVFPLHTPTVVSTDPDFEGGCSCGKETCRDQGKHPRTQHGLLDATTYIAKIRHWWEMWPDANIGIRTGEVSNLLVIDVDNPKAFLKLQERVGELPETIQVKTGNGFHLHYEYPEGHSISSANDLPHGIDLRANGSYIVAPPSKHLSGEVYQFIKPEALFRSTPEVLLPLLKKKGRSANKVGGAIPKGARNNDLASLAGKVRHAGGTPEEIEDALLSFNKTRCKPPLSKDEVGKIAASISQYPVTGGLEIDSSDPKDWPKPLPLPGALVPVKPFNPMLLPEKVRPWVKNVAHRMTPVPIDYAAVSCMVTLASAVGTQIAIRPKQFDDWSEVPNMWGAIVGRPGVLKSPALSEFTHFLKQLDKKEKEIFDEDMIEFQRKKRHFDAEKKVVDKKIAVAYGKNKIFEAEEMSDKLHEKSPEQPIRKRFMVNDATTEKLGVLLADNPQGLLVFRDELIGWVRSLDVQNQSDSRSFFLEGWNGKGKYSFHRVTRPTIEIKTLCLSVLGGIQPNPLRAYLAGSNLSKNSRRDDGLLQRIGLLVWPDIDMAKPVDEAPDETSRNQTREVYERLSNLDIAEIGAEGGGDDSQIPYLRFSSDAQEEFNKWLEELTKDLAGDKNSESVQSHLSKYRSMVPSIALIIHLANGEVGPVGLESLLQAIGWEAYLRSHARRVYAQAGNTDIESARELGRHILNGDTGQEFTLRDVWHRRHWSHLSNREETEKALFELEDLNWIKSKRINTGGRPKIVYKVNPKLKIK